MPVIAANRNEIVQGEEVFGSPLDYFKLMKPRVMSLVVFTAFVGYYTAISVQGYSINPVLACIGIFAIALGAGASGVLNQWYDRDIDEIMVRTKDRPIPLGKILPSEAFSFGIISSIISIMILGLAVNWLAASLLAFTIFFYAVVYTVWLKRNTVQNIVIGGIAGSTPPVIGWCAAEGNLQISMNSFQEFINSIFDIGGYMPWFMFLLIFLWTPPHFWALALYRSEEYKKVGVPMLPNVKGKQRTLLEMKVYAMILILLSITAPLSYHNIEFWDEINLDIGNSLIILNTMTLSIWYGLTVWKIDITEENDENNRMPTASHSFFISLSYLAFMFIALVLSSIGVQGSIISLILVVILIFRNRRVIK